MTAPAPPSIAAVRKMVAKHKHVHGSVRVRCGDCEILSLLDAVQPLLEALRRCDDTGGVRMAESLRVALYRFLAPDAPGEAT